MPEHSKHFASALAEPKFALFSAGQFISQFGDFLAQIALIAAVGEFTTRAPLAYSQIPVAIALPALLFGPFIGVLIDRRSKRRMLMLADGARALIILAIPVLIKLTGTVIVLFPLVCLNYLFVLFANSARVSYIPYLVPPEKIFAANAVMDFINKLAGVLGFVGGGLLVVGQFWKHLHIEPWEAGFYLDSLSFAASLLTLALIKSHETLPERTREEGFMKMWQRRWSNIKTDLAELKHLYLLNHKVRFVTFSLFLVSIFGGSLYPLVIVIAQKDLRVGAGTSGVGFLGGLLGGGMMTGALLSGFLLHRLSRRHIIIGGLFGLSLMVMLFAKSSSYWHLLAITFLGGVFLQPVMTAQNTLFHESVDRSIWGRIFSARDIILDAGFVASALTLGFLAQLVLPAFGSVNQERTALFWCGASLAFLTLAGFRIVYRQKKTERSNSKAGSDV
ncbi:MFS transporter [candidate division TA06 bacterium]|nr:MFS transporter [candidate division TA06 bacterium]